MTIETVESMSPGRPTSAVLTPQTTVDESEDELAAPIEIHPALAAYLAGDSSGAERVFTTFAGVVRDAITRFLAFRVRGRIDLAEDLTHEVFLALFRDDGRRLRTFAGRHGCSFAGGLRVVAIRITIDRLRRDARTVALDDETPRMLELRRSLNSESPDPEESMRGMEVAERLMRSIAALGPKDRILAEIHLVRGRSLEEVARLLGVTMNAAYVRKSRILERLRRALEPTA